MILKRKRLFFFLALFFVGGLAFWGGFHFFSSPEPVEKKEALAKPEPAPPPPPQEEIKVLSGTIIRGKSLSATLRAHGLSADMIESIRKHLHPLLNLRRMNPGDTYEL